jgi:hypothetical protein
MDNNIPVISVKRVTISNHYAVQLINERATREHRSAASACAATVIEALGKHNFRDNIIEKVAKSQE